MGKRKYNTEEERIAANRESQRRYYQKNKEKIAERRAEYMTEYRKNNKEKIAKKNAEYRNNNKEKLAEYQAEYYQNNKEKLAEHKAEYYQNNKEKLAEHKAEYYQNNKEKIAERRAEYLSTKYGRANNLLRSYRQFDRKKDRGECTLTEDWIVNNVFSGQVCHYCGESDWRKLGCDRIDNAIPHTPENVVPCCGSCNVKKKNTPYDLYMKMIRKIV